MPRSYDRAFKDNRWTNKDGALWFGFSGGLFRFDGTSFVNVTRSGPWR